MLSLRPSHIGNKTIVAFNPRYRTTYVEARMNSYSVLVNTKEFQQSSFDLRTKFDIDMSRVIESYLYDGIALKNVEFHIAKLLPPLTALGIHRYKLLDHTATNLSRLWKHINEGEPKDFDTKYMIVAVGERMDADRFDSLLPKPMHVRMIDKFNTRAWMSQAYPNLKRQIRKNIAKHIIGSNISSCDLPRYIPKRDELAGISFGIASDHRYIVNQRGVNSIHDIKYEPMVA